jgi:putative aldouronate transport system substrate-binding protein
MTKRLLLMAALLLTAALVFATGQAESTAGDDDLVDVSALWKISRGRIIEQDSLLTEKLREDFGVNVTWEHIDAEGAREKILLLFLSGDYPDWIWRDNQRANAIDRWGPEGFLVPMSDHWDQLPAYRALYSDEEWVTLQRRAASLDGTVYYLPAKPIPSGYSPAWHAHSYAKVAMEEWGVDYPTTLDEFREVMEVAQQNKPDTYAFVHRHGVEGLMNQLAQSFRTWSTHFEDPDEDGDLVYGPTSDKFRDMLIFLSELYDDGYIDPEFPTSDRTRWEEDIANLNGLFWMWYPGNKQWISFNVISGYDREIADGPDTQWYWGEEILAAYPDLGPFVDSGGGPFNSWGTMLTDQVTGEKLDRMLEFFNWTATEEGTIFTTLGVEGITYEVDDDGTILPVPPYDEIDVAAQGVSYVTARTSMFEWTTDPSSQFIREFKELRSEQVESLGYDYFRRNPYYDLTEAESTETGSLETQVVEVRDVAALRFVTDQNVDPSDDADWQSYLDEMNRAGLERWTAILRTAWERGQN